MRPSPLSRREEEPANDMLFMLTPFKSAADLGLPVKRPVTFAGSDFPREADETLLRALFWIKASREVLFLAEPLEPVEFCCFQSNCCMYADKASEADKKERLPTWILPESQRMRAEGSMMELSRDMGAGGRRLPCMCFIMLQAS